MENRLPPCRRLKRAEDSLWKGRPFFLSYPQMREHKETSSPCHLHKIRENKRAFLPVRGKTFPHNPQKYDLVIRFSTLPHPMESWARKMNANRISAFGSKGTNDPKGFP